MLYSFCFTSFYLSPLIAIIILLATEELDVRRSTAATEEVLSTKNADPDVAVKTEP